VNAKLTAHSEAVLWTKAERSNFIRGFSVVPVLVNFSLVRSEPEKQNALKNAFEGIALKNVLP
jgi:hypothetical protein